VDYYAVNVVKAIIAPDDVYGTIPHTVVINI
jgi:hypothetical protein